MVDTYKLELDALIKKAQEEPGIVDLLAVYGQYGEVLKKSQEYLAKTRPRTIITTTAGTS
jgi:hypothetical protein